eukprot:TRINITY_DN12616_c0_g6_i1.p1 TRINITY_DN12616_c0_g6~~TRINITY_DN12616_c0_g6_i1.p1  ORF type:complete len:739 (+),score=130.22 TRINITY_DN12616_c0_g6_i1:37-2217(+)
MAGLSTPSRARGVAARNYSIKGSASSPVLGASGALSLAPASKSSSGAWPTGDGACPGLSRSGMFALTDIGSLAAKPQRSGSLGAQARRGRGGGVSVVRSCCDGGGGASSSNAPAKLPGKSIGRGGNQISAENLLWGVTSEMSEENNRHNRAMTDMEVAAMKQSQAAAAVSNVSRSLAEAEADENEFLRCADDYETSMRMIRQRHEEFGPLSPQDAARRAKRMAEEAAESEGVSRRKPLTRSQFMTWKYVRKVDEPAPALVRTERENKEVGPNQQSVQFNATVDALRPWRPKARREVIDARTVEKDTHMQLVAATRKSRKAAALAAKIADGQRAAGLLGHTAPVEVEEEVKPGPANQWMAIIAAMYFAARLHEESKLRKMKHEELLNYVSDTETLEKLQRFTAEGGDCVDDIFSKSVLIGRCVTDTRFSTRAMLLTQMVKTRFRRRAAERAARVAMESMRRWQTSGRLLLLLKRFSVLVRRVQRWWRVVRCRLAATIEKVCEQWVRVERADLAEEIVREDAIMQTRAHLLENETRIDLRMLSDSVRRTFVEHELRARRYKLLPAIALYQDAVVRWKKRMFEWFENMRVTMLLRGAEDRTHLETDVFLLPPSEPSSLPNDEEVLDMISRARRHKGAGGWMQVEFVKDEEAARKKRSGEDPALPAYMVEEELSEEQELRQLQNYGLDPLEMPTYRARRPRENAGACGSLTQGAASPLPTPRPVSREVAR